MPILRVNEAFWKSDTSFVNSIWVIEGNRQDMQFNFIATKIQKTPYRLLICQRPLPAHFATCCRTSANKVQREHSESGGEEYATSCWVLAGQTEPWGGVLATEAAVGITLPRAGVLLLALGSREGVTTARTVVGVSPPRLGCHLRSGFQWWGQPCHRWARGKALPQRGRWLGSHRLVGLPPTIVRWGSMFVATGVGTLVLDPTL
jgi:hypothetical protein